MRKLFAVLVLVVLALAGTAYWYGQLRRPSGAATSAEAKTLYTCGMHPQIVQDSPGNCPICGMKLTPMRKQPEDSRQATDTGTPAPTAEKTSGTGRKIKYYKSTMLAGEVSQSPGKDSMGMDMVPVYEEETSDSSAIRIDPVTIQNMGIRTEMVQKGPVVRNIRTVGAIDYSEPDIIDVTTKFKGWIEKLYVDSVGMAVRKGDPLFEIYSPDLYSAAREYLVAAKAGNQMLKASAITRLKYFDVPAEEIAELEKTGQVKKTLRIDVPGDGVVLEKMAVEGKMVDAGEQLFRIANLSTVWVQSQIYEQDLPVVQLGQEAIVTLSYYPDRKFAGRVTYIYPTVDEKTRTARVRMEFHNPGMFLKPGMFVTVDLKTQLASDALLVPDTAILRSGERNTVFVALDGGRFDPRDVTVGARSSDNRYQVIRGLNEGERVVTSGQFMLDSESQLREAVQKMIRPGAATESGTMRMEEMAPHIPAMVSPTPGPESFVCPMPEHASIQYSHGGKCPICGMTLIPGTATKPEAPPTPSAGPARGASEKRPRQK